jgi:hypothetical protein
LLSGLGLLWCCLLCAKPCCAMVSSSYQVLPCVAGCAGPVQARPDLDLESMTGWAVPVHASSELGGCWLGVAGFNTWAACGAVAALRSRDTEPCLMRSKASGLVW